MASVTASAITVDISGLDETLKSLVRDQVPYAKKEAMNALAKDTARVEKLEMMTAFDRPTPFVLRGMKVLKWANKRDPTAALSGQGGAGVFRSRYAESVKRVLEPQIEGGTRRPMSSERRLRQTRQIGLGQYLIGVDRNAYGNVRGPEYQRMLSYFRAYRGASVSGRTDLGRMNRALGQAANRRGMRYFVQRTGRNYGIYRVTGKGRPRLIWYVTGDAPTYRVRFDFYGEAQRHASRWAGYFARKAMDKALATRR